MSKRSKKYQVYSKDGPNNFQRVHTMTGWQHTKSKAYIESVEQRLLNVRLTWVEQFLDIITNKSDGSPVSINDFGCQSFQFYKGLKSRSLNFDYHGYDIEEKYIEIGLRVFPCMVGKYSLMDISVTPPHRVSNISVMSATLEHILDYRSALRNILAHTSRLVILRTFFGDRTHCSVVRENGASHDYLIWEFSFSEIMGIFDELGFTTSIIRDQYTDSMPKYLSHEYVTKGIVRSQYVLVGERAT